MRLLISVTDAVEAHAALEGGADIIDVKNPAEGALGAASVGALHDIRPLLPPDRPLSAALGESGAQPGVLALAAYGAAACGAAYVKVGLRAGDPGEALALLRTVRRAAHHANPACILVAVGYADAARIGALPWAMLPELARAARIGGCMIDTAVKDGRGLFDYCDVPALAGWLAECRAAGLRCALAGALREADLPALCRLRPDIAGFRGAACIGDRVSGRVDAGRVAALRAAFV
jgi:uncharacterized protein (UPF0264 family)